MPRNTHTPIVTRIAPSPTGRLHIGTVRTALINYLYAKKFGGSFILRFEDTDKARSTRESEDEITEGLAWLGLSWDALYRQSERTQIYRGYLEKIIAEGKAYISTEPKKDQPDQMINVVRLKNPGTVIQFSDMVRGEITFDTTELGDFVIARDLDDALYHFTVVVDDHEMGITHVIRGEDHISNTPRQILIQEAIGALRPSYTHLPLILATDRTKLSKRKGTTSLATYREEGYVVPALINYFALLGWNSGTDEEFFSLEKLIAAFELEGVQKGGAIFDIEKLKWFNREYLKSYTPSMYHTYALPFLDTHITTLPQYTEARRDALIPILHERAMLGRDIFESTQAGEYDFCFSRPLITAQLLQWKNDAAPRAALPRLQRVAEIIAPLPESISPDRIREALMPYADEVGKGEVLWPLRVALTGRERSPDPFTVISIIGSAETYQRVTHACDVLLTQT